jgi:hypothetical protein
MRPAPLVPVRARCPLAEPRADETSREPRSPRRCDEVIAQGVRCARLQGGGGTLFESERAVEGL